jgi:hypothetical protein
MGRFPVTWHTLDMICLQNRRNFTGLGEAAHFTENATKIQGTIVFSCRCHE